MPCRVRFTLFRFSPPLYVLFTSCKVIKEDLKVFVIYIAGENSI